MPFLVTLENVTENSISKEIKTSLDMPIRFASAHTSNFACSSDRARLCRRAFVGMRTGEAVKEKVLRTELLPVAIACSLVEL
jgi:hypothetical protein